jgi:hypothetical protein
MLSPIEHLRAHVAELEVVFERAKSKLEDAEAEVARVPTLEDIRALIARVPSQPS